ncbi:TRAP transporter substrate-binding protein DctP [Nibricoccus aquaticus]|uniref:TRAP transporter substrate-binding protein DctP n=1 Tax=Nibricoccus aquaticus TaxID=2576891 RepID=A0A290Q8V4_9BACT|nr:TRAP transporter substrate-binding protein [Nibricoccus aquaticus]ATC64677.1 TRAP transporter substrate-binding protein DctP [Nibricoccus aquaticus]
MDRKAFSFLFVGLIVGALLSASAFIGFLRAERASASAEGGRNTILKLGHSLDQAHPVHAAMEFMAKRVDELSSGAVKIQVFPNGQLGSEPECIEQCQRGALAMVKTSAGAMEGFVPDMAVFGLPYLFRDEDHYWNVLNGPLGQELLAAGDPIGVHGLCYYDSGSRSFYTVGKPIQTPADVKELKLRVMSSKTARDLIITLGGGPTPIPWGELYTALQQSMVNGAENNPPSFLTSRHYEVAKYFTLNEHTRIPDVIIFSTKIWENLPEQSRKWVQQAADESVVFQRKLWKEKTEEALVTVEKAGVTIYRPEKQPFINATASMYNGLEGRMAELVRRIREVK